MGKMASLAILKYFQSIVFKLADKQDSISNEFQWVYLVKHLHITCGSSVTLFDVL